MNKEEFKALEKFMLCYVETSVHEAKHIYRVLYMALQIAESIQNVDTEVLIAAALLHDAGREQAQLKGTSHAEEGARMALKFLNGRGWSKEKTKHVIECVRTHSRSGGLKPQSIEAKILYDADKLDLAGATGAARATIFGARLAEPWYTIDENGLPNQGEKEEKQSLWREHTRNLQNIAESLYTAKGKQIAKKRQKAMEDYFVAMKEETTENYKKGMILLAGQMQQEEQ